SKAKTAAANARERGRDRIRAPTDMTGISPVEFSAKTVRNGASRYHRPSSPAKPPKAQRITTMITETAVHHLSATELLDLYRRKTLSPVEVTKAVLARIEHWEPSLKATYALDPKTALADAGKAEARWVRGEPLGALDGVPAMIKENIATKGVPVPV